jgi:hypothetical protein
MTPGVRRARNIGVGCFTFVIGAFSAAMVAVLIGTVIETIRRSPRCDGLPICNWYVYALIGAILGAVSLPVLVLRRLRQSDARDDAMDPRRG